MKTRLTHEESQHLIDLGVSKEKTSETELYNDPSSWVKRVASIFSLEDFLNGEILPKEINEIEPLIIEWSILTKKWFTYYDSCEQGSSAEELIDALYKLTCWYYEKFLKVKENETIDQSH